MKKKLNGKHISQKFWETKTSALNILLSSFNSLNTTLILYYIKDVIHSLINSNFMLARRQGENILTLMIKK